MSTELRTELKAWPSGVRSAVAITVEVDGAAFWIDRDEEFTRMPIILSQAEFGPKVGLGRVIDVLDRFGIGATFFVPGTIAERYPAQVAGIADRGHEVAHHGYRHEKLGDPDEQRTSLDQGSAVLERLTGSRPRGYRAPRGEHTPETPQLLLDAGFAYDSTLSSWEKPYILANDGGRSLVELPVSWVADDAPYFAYSPTSQLRIGTRVEDPMEVVNTFTTEFDGTYRYGTLFTLTIRPQFIGRPGRITILEQLIAHIRGHRGAAFFKLNDLADLTVGSLNSDVNRLEAIG